LGDGALVAAGEGPRGGSSIELVGDGNGGFALRFELSLAFAFGSSTTTSGELPAGSGVDAFTFWFELSGVVLPPIGRFASGEPVAGVAGSTGLLFGSAASVVPGLTGAG
jgi:hypothetical protein